MAELTNPRLASLLESLATTGKSELDNNKVRELKQICKQSSENVAESHAWIMKHLRTKHSEVRLSCLQIIEVLFDKSSHFRDLLMNDFQVFLELVTGFTLSKKPRSLPPPEHVAKRLRKCALDAVTQWTNTHGNAYPRLEVASRFLKSQTQTLTTRHGGNGTDGTSVISRREQMRVSTLARQADRARDELEDRKGQIVECLSELRSSVELLIPTLEDFTQTGHSIVVSDFPSRERSANAHTLPSNYEIIVEINQKSFRIRRTEDNAAVVDTLSERLKQVEETVLPELRRWLQCFQRTFGFEESVRECIDYKNSLTQLQNKASTLGVESKRRTDDKKKTNAASSFAEHETDDDDVDADEFVDVSGSSRLAAPMVAGTIDRLLAETEYGLPPVTAAPAISENETKTTNTDSPTNSTSTDGLTKSINCILHPSPKNGVASMTEKGNTSKTNLTTSMAPSNTCIGKSSVLPPIVPYGVDLEYWGRENELSLPDCVAPLDAVWSMQSGEKTPAAELLAASRTRTYAYNSEWKPVEHTCRVPLRSGKLCPRQDRLKCPLHGLIIPRDAVGQPLNAEQAANLSPAQKKGILGHLVKSPTDQDKPWEDAELRRDIEAQTGVTFTTAASRVRSAAKSPARTGGLRNRLRRYSNLTDVNAAKKTVTKRLERKLFDTKTVRRVGEQMDRDVRKRNDEKFQHQWNYSS